MSRSSPADDATGDAHPSPLVDASRPRVFPTLAAVVDYVATSQAPVYVRFSVGPEHDRTHPSVDHESGLRLPGWSANPLHPPSWWRGRSLADWVARQICTYQHLRERDPDRRCWLVHGVISDRGPDNEPLLVDLDTVGILADDVIAECSRRAGESQRAEDQPDDDGTAPWQSPT